MTRSFSSIRRGAAAFALFTSIAALYLWPLWGRLATHIGPDAGDPTLNATILWWNATVVPLTSAWWNQPWFHPVPGVTAFTENLLGIAPISTPLYWITRDPIVTYNLTFFLTWPLSALAGFLLVKRLTGRIDAGLVAGLAFGFTPYRVSAELGHLQSLAVFWLPLALLSLHAYLEDSRARWLVVFGVAWVLQSLANGYYMLFGAVLIALWLAYFGSTARAWRASLRVAGVWIASSLLLLPIFLGYHRIHETYGMHRTFEEARAFSAQADSFVQGSGLLRFWRDSLPVGNELLFPGLMVVAILGAAVIAGLSAARPGETRTQGRAAVQKTLAVLAMASCLGIVAWLGFGAWALRAGGTTLFRMSDPGRALLLFGVCAVALIFIAPIRDAIKQRSPFVFYSAVAVLMGVLACGPVIVVRGEVLMDPAPYRWLMALPGFDQLRVPSRFWMMGVLCLSVAAGLGYARLVAREAVLRGLILIAVTAGILVDGWMTALPLKPVPELWTDMQGSDARLPLLELPIGPGFDNAATIRTTTHHRRVLNGVSGYDPPHYSPLLEGLRARDPRMIEAIASLGPFEISIERANDRDEGWQRYVESVPGAVRVSESGERVMYRVPQSLFSSDRVGVPMDILSVQASRGDAASVHDGSFSTSWADAPQHDNQWLLVELGSPGIVGGVSLAVARHAAEFPRHLAVDLSLDGTQFETVWQGSPAPATFRMVIWDPLGDPRTAWVRIAFHNRAARFVRLRQTATARNAAWRLAELWINGPAGARANR